MTQFFASGGQSIGALASASVLSMNIQELISFRIEYWSEYPKPNLLKQGKGLSHFKELNQG